MHARSGDAAAPRFPKRSGRLQKAGNRDAGLEDRRESRGGATTVRFDFGG
jgi:hypothetical protein